MAARDVVFENGTTVTLIFSYHCGMTSTKFAYLETLGCCKSFIYPIQDDSTFAKICVDYLIINSEGTERLEPTNLIINTDTMIKFSKICVVDSKNGGEAADTPRQFELSTVARATIPEAGWILSATKTAFGFIANVVPGGNSQHIPR